MKDKVLLDTNVFVLLIIGLLDRKRISKHKRTSIYSEKDFNFLLTLIPDFENIITTPNIWTEIDNLLNKDGNYQYISLIQNICEKSNEIYFETKNCFTQYFNFPGLGITDIVLLDTAKQCKYFISDDSLFCDIARAQKIRLIDFKEWHNNNL